MRPVISGLSGALSERKESSTLFNVDMSDVKTIKPEYITSSEFFDNIANAINKMKKPIDSIKKELASIGFDPEIATRAFVSAFLNQSKTKAKVNEKKRYSLLDLLEEQMVPMPALGAGSAQYDSRRVEDPFDIDPRTMSLLGLLGAEEVDIKETDVDTDLDGIPNRLDDEDDTPQGFGGVMERFLRNTHQKEDSYKKEKQERQFGLSHAALLKKKYYGRY